jgi:hypothetical protein
MLSVLVNLVWPVARHLVPLRDAWLADRRDREKFKYKHGVYPDLKNPRTFNEKVMWKKRHDRNPLIPLSADKYRVREYLAMRLGPERAAEVSIPLLHVGDDADAIPFDALPPDYIVKANHGTGWNIIVRHGEADRAAIREACARWLRTPFGYLTLEWGYTQIPRLVVIEKLLTDKNGDIPGDYRLFVFHGTVRMIQVESDRYASPKRNLYDRDWNLLPVTCTHPNGPIPPPPENLAAMVTLAETLAQPFDFLRVDLYGVDDRLYVGELTHYPSASMAIFRPPSFDAELGAWWTLKKGYWR